MHEPAQLLMLPCGCRGELPAQLRFHFDAASTAQLTFHQNAASHTQQI
jgi:hypothetical protein